MFAQKCVRLPILVIPFVILRVNFDIVSTQGLYLSLIMLGCQDVEAVVDALGNLTIWFYKLTVPGI